MADRIGQRLGSYTITQLLGQGGFAEVYLGEHIYLKSQAAVKVLQARLSSPDDMDSFLKEAQTIARLSHPHIIRVLDFGVEAEIPYLVMDYAPNGTLRQRHQRGTPVPLPTVVLYVKQIADALQYAHDELRLIHRDIKPENMLLGRRNEVLLSDFGIALVAQSSRYQGTQDVIGTVAYMSPEQIQGKPRAASDQYSLGVVVYEWLTGDRPFQGSFTEMCTQHMFAQPPLLREKNPQLSPDVERIVMQALAKDPRQRFQSIQTFATTLEQASQSAQVGSPYAFNSLSTNTIPEDPSSPSAWISSVPSAAQPSRLVIPPPNALPGNAQTRFNDMPVRPLTQQTPSWSQPVNTNAQSDQQAQQKIVLSTPPINTLQARNSTAQSRPPQQGPLQPPAPGHLQQQAANQFSPPRTDAPYPYAPPNNFQQANRFPPQRQEMAPQQPARPHEANPYAPGGSPQVAKQEAQSAASDEGWGILSAWKRPLIATIIGIILFCIVNNFHPYFLGRYMTLILVIPIFFGAAFGPIVGLLVGLGGVIGINALAALIGPQMYSDLPVRLLTTPYQLTHYPWSPFLINTAAGFTAGLSMLRKKRYPSIGSTIRACILSTIGLVASVGFVLYSSSLLHLINEIGPIIILNIGVAFALLVVYSIIGSLLDPRV